MASVTDTALSRAHAGETQIDSFNTVQASQPDCRLAVDLEWLLNHCCSCCNKTVLFLFELMMIRIAYKDEHELNHPN